MLPPSDTTGVTFAWCYFRIITLHTIWVCILWYLFCFSSYFLSTENVKVYVCIILMHWQCEALLPCQYSRERKWEVERQRERDIERVIWRARWGSPLLIIRPAASLAGLFCSILLLWGIWSLSRAAEAGFLDVESAALCVRSFSGVSVFVSMCVCEFFLWWFGLGRSAISSLQPSQLPLIYSVARALPLSRLALPPDSQRSPFGRFQPQFSAPFKMHI